MADISSPQCTSQTVYITRNIPCKIIIWECEKWVYVFFSVFILRVNGQREKSYSSLSFFKTCTSFLVTYGSQYRWLVEQLQDTTGKYLSGHCEWSFALGLKDTVN